MRQAVGCERRDLCRWLAIAAALGALGHLVRSHRSRIAVLVSLTTAPLLALLHPFAGERILAVGSGAWLLAPDVATRLGPRGRLDIVDVRPSAADRMPRPAIRAATIVPTFADGGHLPFPDASFDAAYLGGRDQPVALDELRRVLRPGGRLVVVDCPGLGAPGWRGLLRSAPVAGFAVTRRWGPPYAHHALLRPIPARGAVTGAADAWWDAELDAAVLAEPEW